jgi:hypothetical protein
VVNFENAANLAVARKSWPKPGIRYRITSLMWVDTFPVKILLNESVYTLQEYVSNISFHYVRIISRLWKSTKEKHWVQQRWMRCKKTQVLQLVHHLMVYFISSESFQPL